MSIGLRVAAIVLCVLESLDWSHPRVNLAYVGLALFILSTLVP